MVYCRETELEAVRNGLRNLECGSFLALHGMPGTLAEDGAGMPGTLADDRADMPGTLGEDRAGMPGTLGGGGHARYTS
jgi:hypothetical protein